MIPRILSYKNPVVPQATSEKCAQKLKRRGHFWHFFVILSSLNVRVIKGRLDELKKKTWQG